jgi:hypothetical protein
MAYSFGEKKFVVFGIWIKVEKIISVLKAIAKKPTFLSGSIHKNEAPLELWNVVVWLSVCLLCFLFVGQCISRE